MCRFRRNRMVLIQTVFGHESYIRTSSRLQKAGIPFKSKSIWTQRIGMGRSPFFDIARDSMAQYEIYVKPEDRQKASDAIYRS